MTKKHSYVFIKNSFENKGFTLLSKTYVNANKHIKCLCPKGHTFYISWSRFSIGRGCPECKRIKFIGNKYGLTHGLSYTKEYKKIYSRKWISKYPWLVSFYRARQRCNNPKDDSYKYYGGRGIKFLLTKDEIKSLWFEDKAYNMKRPSIDRKKSNNNYELSNCRFIELSDNIKNMHKEYIKIKIEG